MTKFLPKAIGASMLRAVRELTPEAFPRFAPGTRRSLFKALHLHRNQMRRTINAFINRIRKLPAASHINLQHPLATRMSERIRQLGFRPVTRTFGAALCAATVAALAQSAPAQFNITATNIAPATALSGQSTAVLRVSVSNPVLSGIANIQLSEVGLRFEQATGLPLSPQQAAALISGVEIHKDMNGSGLYEAAADPLVSNSAPPSIASGGILAVSLAAADPEDLLVASGQSRAYFIIVRLNAGAATAVPNSFRVTHLANGPDASGALNAGTGLALSIIPTPDVTSSTMTATTNHAPTTTGLADVVVFDNVATSTVPLFPAFHDAEDAPDELTYAVTGNTNPGLFQFTGINPTNGILSIQYTDGISGSARLTVRATDTAGNVVTTDFSVTVAPFTAFTDFAEFQAASNGGTWPGPLDVNLGNGLSSLLNYAFFLNDGVAGLPRMEGTGRSRIFLHLRPKYASDLLYHYEISQDLITWVPAAKDVHYYQHTTDLRNGAVRVELLLLVNWPKAFMRVRTELFEDAAAPPAPANNGSGAAQAPPPPAGDPWESIQGTVFFPQQTVLSNSQLYASGIASADFDMDGFADVVAASQNDNTVAWYRNNGNGSFGAKQVLSNAAAGAIAVAAGDLDADGRPDVVAVSQIDSEITVIRHDATGAFLPPEVISTAIRFPTSVCLGDLDGDGKPDIIANSFLDRKIAWCPNIGNGAFAPAQVITWESRAPWAVSAADLDGDGALDIVVGAINDYSVCWYKGNGNGTFGAKQNIGTGLNTPASVAASDLDGDGLRDVLAALAADDKIVWWRNLGNGTFGPTTLISDRVNAPYFVNVADLNGDGRPEVLSASIMDNKLAWYRNWGGGNFGDPATNQGIISPQVIGPFAMATADFNRDGVVDVASASQDDSKVAVHINRGGQTAFTTTNTAPPIVVNGQRRDVLRIAASNRGRPGDDAARLTLVALLFESAPGVPLASSAANRLIETLYIYADGNASGTFERGIDAVVAAVPYLALTAGKLTVAIQATTPDAEIPPGETRNFFVVPEWKPNASAQAPNAFRVTHLGVGLERSVLKNASTGSVLTLESLDAENVSSSILTAAVNTPPTSIGLPSVTVHDTVTPTFIPVLSYFNDVEDGPAGLRYKIENNTNPGLFAFAGVDPTTGLLGLGYRPGVSGTAVLTVRATDSVGASVFALCNVSVALSNTFGNWASLNGWSGGPGGVNTAGVLKYAFGLNAPAGGNTAGLPHVHTQGKTRIVSHLKQRWATDLTYHYEISQDLANWSPAIRGVHFHEFSTNLPNGMRRSDLVLMVDWPKAFLRVRAVVAN